MKKLAFLISMLTCLSSIPAAFPGYPEWRCFFSGAQVHDVRIEGDDLWLGTSRGLFRMNSITGSMVLYDPFNSGMPLGPVYTIAIDDAGVKWIGTANLGLVKLDGAGPLYFTIANSGLQENHISAIAFDRSGNTWIGDGVLWIGLRGGGMVELAGSTGTVYRTGIFTVCSNPHRPDRTDSRPAAPPR